MSDKIQVISGLYDQLNKGKKDQTEVSVTAVPGTTGPETAGKQLSEKTLRALEKRRDEYLRLCKDLRAKQCELNALFAKQQSQLSFRVESVQKVLQQLETASKEIQDLPVPSEDSPNYQGFLSDACREAERLRFVLIEAAAQMEETEETKESQSVNFFADMSSLSFGQLFRTGFALALPVILSIFFAMLILGATIVLTFRVF